MTTLAEIDLAPFCWREDSLTKYEGAAQPWTAGEWTYATDGRIIIRVPRRELPEPAGRVPDPSQAGPWEAEGDWQPLPPLFTLEVAQRCTDCEGKGMRPPHVVCPTCGDEIEIPGALVSCDWCAGSGLDAVKLGGHYYAGKYLARISALPGVTYWIGEHTQEHSKHTAHLLHFRFEGGGRGMLLNLIKGETGA